MDKNLPETRLCHRATETQKRPHGGYEGEDASERRARRLQDRRTQPGAGHGLSRKPRFSTLSETRGDLGWGRCGPAKEPGSAAGRRPRQTPVRVARSVSVVPCHLHPRRCRCSHRSNATRSKCWWPLVTGPLMWRASPASTNAPCAGSLGRCYRRRECA